MTPVLLLPGAVLPAALAYPALLDSLRGLVGAELHAVTKDLEVYAGPEPPPGYGLDTEVDGIRRAADEAGFERFHLVGYSGGGAASVAFAAAAPERLLSLALLEAAWAGNDGLAPEEVAVQARFREIARLPVPERMAQFVRAQLRDGVVPPPPPPGDPPPWMALRPAGIGAFIAAFDVHRLDVDRLRGLHVPVFYAVGGLSNPDYFQRQANRLAGIFDDFTLEVYPERHHFDPPHRIEPDRLAASLVRLWARSTAGSRP